jgi:anti-sigma regulatory factor (Ser/Thr protein kinase)
MTSGAPSFTLRVRSSVEAIGPASEQAETWLAGQGVSPDAAYLVSLAIEELVTNCIKYGYDDSQDHTVVIVISVEAGALRVEVIDDGRPFNPLDAPAPDLSLEMADRPVGGLGIHLLRELADEVAYERRDGTNHLKLTKRISPC